MNSGKDPFSIQLPIKDKFNDEEIIKSLVEDIRTTNIRKEIGRKYEKTKFIISFSKKDKKYTLYINDQIIDFGQKVNDITKGYETFNVVSETGDSIYSLTLEELIIAERREGQVFVSEDNMREIRREVDKRSGNKAEADL